MTEKQKQILEFIKVIRQSFSDAKIVYLFGWCYWFYEILKHIYPESVAYMIDQDHVVTKIDWVFYDISWIYELEESEKATEMDYSKHYIAESWKDWQRLERMLKKYSDIN